MERIAVAADACYGTIFRNMYRPPRSYRTKDGRQLSEEVLVNCGNPEQPSRQLRYCRSFRTTPAMPCRAIHATSPPRSFLD
jgi:hypothetical protein